MNHDNIINAIPRAYVEAKVSPRTNSEYHMLNVQFANGYTLKLFITAEQVKLIEYAVKEQPQGSLGSATSSPLQ